MDGAGKILTEELILLAVVTVPRNGQTKTQEKSL
jgi:hypothetical protein